MDRRDFLKHSVAAVVIPPAAGRTETKPVFEISLAQWSLHRTLSGGKLDPLEFPAYARRVGLDAVEYVNSFFKDKARDGAYLGELKRRADDAGVRSLLIMVDGEGALGDPDAGALTKVIERHRRWAEAASFLDCHSIRVNARSQGTPQEQRDRVSDGLRQLTEAVAPQNLNVIVENHGGLSSNGKWLASVMRQVDHPRCGTLPDFGNFRIAGDEWYDRYEGVEELMPFAKAVSAKSNDFDADGNEVHTDYVRMMRIVLDAGYRGYVGIEYEGEELSEDDGITATKALLERVRSELASAYNPR
jgi:sugar phosphate isomerase/epimerase